MANIPGVRLEIQDNVDNDLMEYKVKDLVEFLSSLDQEKGVVWSGKEGNYLMLTCPRLGTNLYICEAVNQQGGQNGEG